MAGDIESCYEFAIAYAWQFQQEGVSELENSSSPDSRSGTATATAMSMRDEEQWVCFYPSLSSFSSIQPQNPLDR